MRHRISTPLLLAVGLAASPAASQAAAPTGWLGDGSARYPSGRFDPTTPLPSGARWVTDLPDWGNASPVVAGGKVCTTVEPYQFLCLAPDDGRVLWKRSVSYLDTVPASERAEATKAADEAKRLRAAITKAKRRYGKLKRKMRKARGAGAGIKTQLEAAVAELDGLKAQLGAYSRFEVPDPIPELGSASATPCTDGEALYSAFGNGVVASVTVGGGALRWARFFGKPEQTMHGYHRGQAASPLLVDGTLVVGMNALYGLDPATGATRWSVDGYRDYGAPSAIQVGGQAMVITPSGWIVRVADGEVLSTDLPLLYFTNVAVHGSQVFVVGAYRDPDTLDRQASAFDVQPSGGRVRVTSLWHTTLERGKTYGAPLVHDGLVYSIDARGTLAVLSAKTGEIYSQTKVALGNEDVMSTPVLAGDALLVAGRSGKMAALGLGKAPEVLGTVELETTRATPVFVGGRMYMRTHEKLWAIGD